MAEAAKNNQTIGKDMTSYLSLIKPMDLIRTLMTSYSSSAMQVDPRGHVSNACYRDVIASVDSLLAGKSWALESENFYHM